MATTLLSSDNGLGFPSSCTPAPPLAKLPVAQSWRSKTLRSFFDEVKPHKMLHRDEDPLHRAKTPSGGERESSRLPLNTLRNQSVPALRSWGTNSLHNHKSQRKARDDAHNHDNTPRQQIELVRPGTEELSMSGLLDLTERESVYHSPPVSADSPRTAGYYRGYPVKGTKGGNFGFVLQRILTREAHNKVGDLPASNNVVSRVAGDSAVSSGGGEIGLTYVSPTSAETMHEPSEESQTILPAKAVPGSVHLTGTAVATTTYSVTKPRGTTLRKSLPQAVQQTSWVRLLDEPVSDLDPDCSSSPPVASTTTETFVESLPDPINSKPKSACYRSNTPPSSINTIQKAEIAQHRRPRKNRKESLETLKFGYSHYREEGSADHKYSHKKVTSSSQSPKPLGSPRTTKQTRPARVRRAPLLKAEASTGQTAARRAMEMESVMARLSEVESKVAAVSELERRVAALERPMHSTPFHSTGEAPVAAVGDNKKSLYKATVNGFSTVRSFDVTPSTSQRDEDESRLSGDGRQAGPATSFSSPDESNPSTPLRRLETPLKPQDQGSFLVSDAAIPSSPPSLSVFTSSQSGSFKHVQTPSTSLVDTRAPLYQPLGFHLTSLRHEITTLNTHLQTSTERHSPSRFSSSLPRRLHKPFIETGAASHAYPPSRFSRTDEEKTDFLTGDVNQVFHQISGLDHGIDKHDDERKRKGAYFSKTACEEFGQLA